jgi:hypothetical protein
MKSIRDGIIIGTCVLITTIGMATLGRFHNYMENVEKQLKEHNVAMERMLEIMEKMLWQQGDPL